jgi:hypothetical protein
MVSDAVALPPAGVASRIRLRVNAFLRKAEITHGLTPYSLGALAPITRDEAKAGGLSLFFTGLPCQQGHLAERYTSNGGCIICKSTANLPAPKKARKRQKEAARRILNRDQEKAAWAAWYPKVREKRLADKKAWRKANPERVKIHTETRRAAKELRCPSWVDRRAIRDFYLNCPDGYSVDHIIPLRGKFVSGLHVPWNLQYLTLPENLSKGIRHE